MIQSNFIRLTILGCGSSPGTPRINGDWGECDPSHPKNKRRRASVLFERLTSCEKKTSVVVDTGPDFREQMLSAKVKQIEAVLFTHAHADHTHGIDDLRSYALEKKDKINIYADEKTLTRMKQAFEYCFHSPEKAWLSMLSGNVIDYTNPINIKGEGGEMIFHPFQQKHGKTTSTGFRIENIAYCSDVNDFPEKTIPYLQGLDLLILDALQYKPHHGHFSVEEALEWIERLKPRRAILTHMHIALDYETLKKKLPNHIEPAFDGMVIEQAYP